MRPVVSVAVGRSVNGEGDWQNFERLSCCLSSQLNIKPRVLTIDPLSIDWHSPLAPDHFRSGCAPIEALAFARELIRSGAEGAVVIRGRDYLKSEYTSVARRQAMAIYGESIPLTEAYDQLAHQFMAIQGLSGNEFCQLRDALYDNYCRTYTAVENRTHDLPGARWLEPVTELFRGVDCANPVVDFDGAMLLTSVSLARDLGVGSGDCVEVCGVGLGLLSGGGPEMVPTIARYEHLQAAFASLDQQLEASLPSLFKRDDLLLELYTCYPVVPMAALLNSGLVSGVDDLLAFIQQTPVTQTGGMNLARGAWNNPALNGLITMHETLLQHGLRQDASASRPSGTRRHSQEATLRHASQAAGKEAAASQYGLVHGNGGLGNRQGVALLSPCRY
ncbi:hypothetical protein G8770_08210 [Aestuariicella hydrocarbonica]|uniref:Uncharacterized protein n=1 Tax=Pseudomaricurvus hydrocarbonicus TaxID=1470433 RepID=A0A9E5JS34_9GAMM|nr:hypothetical protein [Aestuariicella hydrocarbonica]NHO65519.1 hypothetical protein [Aestuariicella hydrocarbonica]